MKIFAKIVSERQMKEKTFLVTGYWLFVSGYLLTGINNCSLLVTSNQKPATSNKKPATSNQLQFQTGHQFIIYFFEKMKRLIGSPVGKIV
jgi:hypothetical protein